MKIKILTFASFISLIITTFSVQAAGFGSLLDDLKGAIKDQIKTKNVQPARKPPPKSDKEDAPSNAVTNYYGESKDVHDYEGALSPDDKICTRIIDPFALSDNASVLLGDAASEAGNLLIKQILNGGGKTPSTEDLLRSTKSKAKKLNWMPMDQEISYGKWLHEQRLKTDSNLFERSKKGRVKRLYAKADKILNRVLLGIKENHPYQFKLFLINNDEINAEALPGGYLYVNTGVLNSEYAELVFAHEIAHVLKRHQTRETQAQLIDTVETYDDLKTLLDSSSPNAGQIAKRAALLHGLFLNYSRQQELQADACSVRIAQRIPGMDLDNKIDPYIASLAKADEVPVNKKLRGKSGHPNYPERSKRMREVVLATKEGKHKK